MSSVSVRRIELRLRTTDPLLEELTHEAEQRGVELQQHIYDLLRGRYLLPVQTPSTPRFAPTAPGPTLSGDEAHGDAEPASPALLGSHSGAERTHHWVDTTVQPSMVHVRRVLLHFTFRPAKRLQCAQQTTDYVKHPP